MDGQKALRGLLFHGIDMATVRRVFDFGCGYGSDLIDIAAAHPGVVAEGYTLSARQTELGNGRADRLGLGARVRLYQRDSAATPFPGSYDLVFGFEVSGLIADKQGLFDNIARHLAPGGRLILAEVLAAGDSSIDLPELSTYSATTGQFAALLAHARLRLVSCIDVSGPIANCLFDPAFDDHLATIAADPAVDLALLRHVAMYPNVGRALESGLMTYALMSAVHDPHAPVGELLARNREALAAPAVPAQMASAIAVDGRADPAGPEDGLAEWLWRIQWEAAARPAPSAAATPVDSAFLLVGGTDALRAAMAAALAGAGMRATGVAHGARCAVSGSEGWTVRPEVPQDMAVLVDAALQVHGEALAGVVHLGGLGLPAGARASRCEGVVGALHLVQALARAGLRNPPRLWLVTAGVHRVAAEAACDATQGPVWGLGRTAAHEHPDLRPSLIDLPVAASAGDIDVFASLLRANGPETQVAVRDGSIFVARLARAQGVFSGHPPVMPRRDGTYLVTGGLGGLGLAVATRLAQAGAGKLVLTGRRANDDAAAAALDAIAATGAEVEYCRIDAADRPAMLALLDAIDQPARPLRGVIHAAGALDDGILQQQNAERFERLLAAKQDGAAILDEGTAHRSLDFFVLFSGLASVLGSPGQGNYAAANAALDAVARGRRARGLPGLSIGWAPWTGIGLVANAAPALSERGVDSLPASTGLDLLMRCLGTEAAELAVMSFDRRRWSQTYPALAASPLLANLVVSAGRAVTAAEAQAGQGLREALLAEPAGWPRRARLEAHVAGVLARVLRLAPEAVERGTALKDLGFDSLMALEARNRLEADTGLKLPVTVIWKHPTVVDLASHLAERMEVPLADLPDAASASVADAGDDGLDTLLDMLEGLSNDETQRRYEAKD
jgi:myxalamid-type polyketide synthase MxaE and MxaD